MHAVARLVLHPHISNIQASWVKMGATGVEACLNAGVNDLGGTLMNESISRAAGARHGQEIVPRDMVNFIQHAGLQAAQRNTLYQQLAHYGRTSKPEPQLSLIDYQRSVQVSAAYSSPQSIPVKVSA